MKYLDRARSRRFGCQDLRSTCANDLCNKHACALFSLTQTSSSTALFIMTSELNQEKADAFENHIFGMVTGNMVLTTIRLGHELGIYAELAKNGPRTSTDLAAACSISPRYAYEWSLHATANGILEYDANKDAFSLPPKHAVLMDTNEGIISIIVGLVENTPYQYPLLKLAYETDGGIFWGDQRGMRQASKLFSSRSTNNSCLDGLT